MSKEKVLTLRGKKAVWAPGSGTGPIDPKRLPEGYPYKEQEAILDGTFEFAMVPPAGVYMYGIADENFTLTDGKAYTVIWDGVAYQCVATMGTGPFAGETFIGSLSNTPVSGAPDTGEPFVFMCNAETASIGTRDTSATHTVKVSTETIHPMAQEFLPAGVGGGGMMVTVTGENDSLTSDKTFAEIAEAVKSNKSVTLCWAGSSGVNSYYQLNQFVDGQGVAFSSVAMAMDEPYARMYTFMIMPDNSVTLIGTELALYGG